MQRPTSSSYQPVSSALRWIGFPSTTVDGWLGVCVLSTAPPPSVKEEKSRHFLSPSEQEESRGIERLKERRRERRRVVAQAKLGEDTSLVSLFSLKNTPLPLTLQYKVLHKQCLFSSGRLQNNLH